MDGEPADERAVWSVVLPVKRLEAAKSRLLLPPEQRARLAAAMAADTVAAALAASVVTQVVVVTDDAAAARTVAGLGARVVADEPAAGLNEALEWGAAQARAAVNGGVATLSADLPALTAAALDDVLRLVSRVGVVGDRVGTGTTLLAAASGSRLRPEYGPESLARHVAAGADDLTGHAAASLRLDVDTLDDLAAATVLGVGPATAAALQELGLPH